MKNIQHAIQAAEEAGLPPKIAPKLEGETLDELRADALEMKSHLGTQPPPAPPRPVPLPDLHAGARQQDAVERGTGWFPKLNGRKG